MSESAKDHRAPAVHPSALAIVDEQEALVFSANHEASQQLVPAGTADRFVDPPPSPSAGANGGPGPQRIELQHGSLDQAAALLREATKYYERHVIAWYTLGRLTEARSARDAIVHYPRVLAAGRPSAGEAGCLLESERSASAQ